MRKRKIVAGILVVGVLRLVNPESLFAKTCPTYASACAAPVSYKVTMNKLEVSTNSDGTGAITLVSTPQQFDIAKANAGAIVGSWFSGASLPEGRYVWMRRTVSRTFCFKGYVTYGGYDWYTSNDPDTANFGSDTNLRRVAHGTYTFTGSDVPLDYAEVCVKAEDPTEHGVSLPSGMSFTSSSIIEEDSNMNFTVAKGQKAKIKITFNVQNTLELLPTGPSTYKLAISEPDVSATVSTE